MMGIKLEAQFSKEFAIDYSFFIVEFPLEYKKDSKDKKKILLTIQPTNLYIEFTDILYTHFYVIGAYESLCWILLCAIYAPNDLNAIIVNIAVVRLTYISFLSPLR